MVTEPIWMALPPEVHSALLSNGPGSGSLLAAAVRWDSLSTEYASVADELSAVLSAVQAGVWQGPSAESYVAANVPYLAWLMQVSANSAAAAAEHQIVAAAYTTALAAMPTLAELAANHAIHAVLVATNFFGINTIPIALNEADYLRMWMQAATTMTTYQTVATAAVASAPQTTVAPPILKANSNTNDTAAAKTGKSQDSEDVWKWSWWQTRIDEVSNAIQSDMANFSSNPSAAITHLLTDPILITMVPHWAGEAISVMGPQLTQLTEIMVGLISPVGSVGGVAGLAGLAGLGQSAAAPMAPVPEAIAPPSEIGPVAGTTPALVAPTTVPATAPTPAPASIAAPAAGVPPAPPPVGVAGLAYPYLVGGGPGVGFGSGMSMRTGAEKKAPQPDTAAAAAAAAAISEQARRPRRRRSGLIDRGYRYEYLDSGAEPDVSAGDRVASDHGAGTLGFAGTAHNADAGQAAGLTTLADDSFGRGPAMPMMPNSWGPGTGGPVA